MCEIYSGLKVAVYWALCARLCVKCLALISFNSHKECMRQVLLSPLFTDEETETERGEITHPKLQEVGSGRASI